MPSVIQAALAPCAALLVYIYIRDLYEKEPVKLLFTGVTAGALSAAVIFCLEMLAKRVDLPSSSELVDRFYTAFVVSAGIEESVKFTFIYFLVWHNKNFNEPVDGIVYSVFVSLGFAGVENILYLTNPLFSGLDTILLRAIFSVPGHGLFGIAMGYYMALCKFEPDKKTKYLFLSILLPAFLHGTFNFILLSGTKVGFSIFVIFVIYLWVSGLKKIRIHLEKSPFK